MDNDQTLLKDLKKALLAHGTLLWDFEFISDETFANWQLRIRSIRGLNDAANAVQALQWLHSNLDIERMSGSYHIPVEIWRSILGEFEKGLTLLLAQAELSKSLLLIPIIKSLLDELKKLEFLKVITYEKIVGEGHWLIGRLVQPENVRKWIFDSLGDDNESWRLVVAAIKLSIRFGFMKRSHGFSGSATGSIIIFTLNEMAPYALTPDKKRCVDVVAMLNAMSSIGHLQGQERAILQSSEPNPKSLAAFLHEALKKYSNEKQWNSLRDYALEMVRLASNHLHFIPISIFDNFFQRSDQCGSYAEHFRQLQQRIALANQYFKEYGVTADTLSKVSSDFWGFTFYSKSFRR